MKKLILALAALCCFSLAQAQITTPQPSPLSKVEQRVGITDFTLTYSRPGVKGRKIFGDLIPFGSIWRFGANSATKLSVSDSFIIAGKALPGGDYALYCIPNQNEWTILVGSDPKVQAGSFDQAKAVANFKVKTEALAGLVETFTMNFSELGTNNGFITAAWERTQVRIPIEVDVDRKVMKAIDKAMQDVGPYWAAANYYYDTNRDLKQALTWADKVVESNPQYWTVHLRAKIYQKMNDCKGATANAERSLALAKEAGNRDYVRMNEAILSSCKGKK